jgi:hypothetical protein
MYVSVGSNISREGTGFASGVRGVRSLKIDSRNSGKEDGMAMAKMKPVDMPLEPVGRIARNCSCATANEGDSLCLCRITIINNPAPTKSRVDARSTLVLTLTRVKWFRNGRLGVTFFVTDVKCSSACNPQKLFAVITWYNFRLYEATPSVTK